MESSNYYYTTDGNSVLGPEPLPSIQRMQRTGDLVGAVQVAREGTQQWISLDDAVRRTTAAPKPDRGMTANRAPEPHSQPAAKPALVGEAPSTGNGTSTALAILLFFLLVITAAGVGLYAWNTFGTKPPKTTPAIVKWEYRRMAFPAVNPKYPGLDSPGRTDSDGMSVTTIKLDEQQLATLGSEGWELVTSFLEMETAFPNFGKDEYVTGLRENVRPQLLVCIFKRPHYE